MSYLAKAVILLGPVFAIELQSFRVLGHMAERWKRDKQLKMTELVWLTISALALGTLAVLFPSMRQIIPRVAVFIGIILAIAKMAPRFS